MKCPSTTVIVIERHNRLSPLPPPTTVLSLFLSSRSIELVANQLSFWGWAPWGWKSRIRVQRDFSSFPIGRQTHSRLNILKTTGSRRHSIEQPTIVHHQTGDLFDVFVDSRGSMVPISALRKFVIDIRHLATDNCDPNNKVFFLMSNEYKGNNN